MIVFSISIAFQLAGAVLLVDNFIPTRKAILKKSFSETGNVIWGDFVHRDKNIMTYGRLQRNARYAYQNFCALLMICVGYLLTPFGINEDPWRETAIIIPFVVAVNIIVRKAAKRIALSNFQENVIVDKEGIEVKGESEDA